MKANVGMEYPVAAPISAYTPYSGISYGAGFVVSQAREANLSYETEDGEFRGDNVTLDSANGVIGYTLEFENTGLSNAVRKNLLGEVKGSNDEYKITGASAPDVGFGYCAEMRDDSSGTSTTKWEAWWFHKIKFSMPNENHKQKERNKEWRGTTISGKGAGVYLSANADHPDFVEHKEFSSLADAKSYLNTKAGISVVST